METLYISLFIFGGFVLILVFTWFLYDDNNSNKYTAIAEPYL